MSSTTAIHAQMRVLRRAKAVAAKRLAHVERSATQPRVRALSAGSPSQSSRLTSRDGRGFEERQPNACGQSAASRWMARKKWTLNTC